MGIFGTGTKFPVNGRLVVITGGSQGMGLEVAKQLARKGASVAIVARSKDKLETALLQIKVPGFLQLGRWLSLFLFFLKSKLIDFLYLTGRSGGARKTEIRVFQR